MRRLRDRLAKYYRANPGDPLIVTVPHHSYIAVLTTASAAPAPVPRVAVLPFHPQGGEEAPTLAQGLADDVIYFLRPHSSLAVLARTSVFSLHSLGLTPSEIADRVAADWIVKGAVERCGDLYRIHAALLQAPGMAESWCQEWTCSAAGISGISQLIGAAVRWTLSRKPGDTAPPLEAPKPPGSVPDAGAHLSYLQGLQFLSRRCPQTLSQAADHFEQAICDDPLFLRPRIGLLETMMVKGLTGFEVTAEESRAFRLLRECTELNPNSADTMTAGAMVLMCFRADLPSALELLRRAVELEPHNILPYAFYPCCLCLSGRLEDAFEAIRQGLRLDPLSPILHSRFGIAALHCGQALEAIEAFEDAIDENPDFPLNYYHQAMALASVGRTSAALQRVNEAEARAGPSPLCWRQRVMFWPGLVLTQRRWK